MCESEGRTWPRKPRTDLQGERWGGGDEAFIGLERTPRSEPPYLSPPGRKSLKNSPHMFGVLLSNIFRKALSEGSH